VNRTLNVVRLQFVNRMTYLWIPLIILGGSFALSLLIYALIPTDAPKYGGGSQAPLWYFFAVGIQSLTLTFPFSQALSITRREFHVGTLLTASLTSAILASVFAVGRVVEDWTGGWGMNGFFFYIPWLTDGSWYQTWLVFFAIAMLFFIVGYASAGVYRRWGGIGLTVALIGVGLLIVGAIAVAGWAQAWGAVFAWLGAQTPIGLAAWALLLVLLLAGTSYATLRRAVP
jgi:hypothetical protein